MLISILVALFAAISAQQALADAPANPQCWGVVTSQLAKEGGVGEHASNQEEPRAGLGNIARLFGFDHVSDLGSFLATVDGVDATQCP
ncbi:MAG: hypothetical protein M5U10_06920 [Candidatus Methanoperedens sp.]|nr:hypothetical protein [Candidatus Methanoperedens sp.]